jgi:hypothetical protein
VAEALERAGAAGGLDGADEQLATLAGMVRGLSARVADLSVEALQSRLDRCES